MKPLQITWILNKIEKNKCVSRNEALNNYISRLGAYIHALKKIGYVFTYGYTAGRKDYVYNLIKKPKTKI
jgi:translation elongation factor EF-Ts